MEDRSAYLEKDLIHCGACHIPEKFLGAVDSSCSYQGALIGDWLAANLTFNKTSGLINEFLKTGLNAHTIAYGPIAEVVEDSTANMFDDDLQVIATYLKTLLRESAVIAAAPTGCVAYAGRRIYVDSCTACHEDQGVGMPGIVHGLRDDAVVQQRNPTTVVRPILYGGYAASTAGDETPVSIPSFGWKLSDQQIADVASYVRSAWGKQAAPVTPVKVRAVRSVVSCAKSAN
jgi:mono/diheme cytochrome c family protein